MGNFERIPGKYPLQIGTPGQSNFLRIEFDAMLPPTHSEIIKFINEFGEHWKAGERTTEGSELDGQR